ncbi:MAG: hypothetical protein FWD98_07135 [Defluviitaleaceae bacterium]|nr:hypothetical protein [Defluviitaleaceae bacterium]
MEATGILRKMGYDRPIVALTANATFGASQMFLEHGFEGFISKPIDPNKLDTCLVKHIGSDPQARHEAAAAVDSAVSGKLVESFLIDAQKSFAVLEPLLGQELDASALKAYTIQTHAMKSALTNIGNFELAAIAGVLEDAGRDADVGTIEERTQSFLQAVREVVGVLQSKHKDQTPDEAEDTAALREQLMAVSTACEMYDMRVKDTINTLKQGKLSRKTREALAEIEKHLLMSDYDDAALLAKQVAESMEG